MIKINGTYISLISVKSKCDNAIKKFLREEQLYPDDLFGKTENFSIYDFDALDYFCGLYETPTGVFASYETSYHSWSIPLTPTQVETLNNELATIISTLSV
jgi:hypothetical protein